MADHGQRIVGSNHRRLVETRHNKWVRFSDKRRETFLSHLASTCNVQAAAAAAGVHAATAYYARRHDPLFRLRWDEALDQGYASLEARLLELAHLSLGDQRGIEPDPRVADMDLSRIMALLRQRPLIAEGRPRGGPGARKPAAPAQIEDVAKHLIKRLKAMGVTLLPPPDVPPHVADENGSR